MAEECSFAPLTPERFGDAEAVFADCGDARKCWCAYWYRSNADYRAGSGDGNREVFRSLVRDGPPPGILAYRDGDPIAWCSVAPRRLFDRLNRSKPLAPVDDLPVWSINCFVVRKKHRRQGLMRLLLRQAVQHARASGAPGVEAYPIDSEKRSGSFDLYLGSIAAFRDEGFVEVARRLPRRPIMRRMLTGGR